MTARTEIYEIPASGFLHDWLSHGRYGERISPSPELTQHILSLPHGAKVAIEFDPRLAEKPVINGFPQDLEADAVYWKHLENLCRTAQVEIVYLDDAQTYTQAGELLMEREKVSRSIETARGEEHSRLFQRRYELAVRTLYFRDIVRGDMMLARIRQEKPDIVVVRTGGLPKLDSREFSFPVYDEVPIDGLSELGPEEGMVLNPGQDLRRELLIRQYRAVTEGRIMAEGSPSFRGTWRGDLPFAGLFEIFLKEGVIEDTHGTATISDVQITDDSAHFVKTYIPEKSSESVLKGSIVYDGVKVRGFYAGTWREKVDPGGRKSFVMLTGDKPITDIPHLVSSSQEAK